MFLTWNVWTIILRPTGESLVGAASDGEEVLDDVLAVGGLSTPTLAQQNDGLVLSSGEEVPVGRLGCAVDVRGCVLPPAALKHLHHLEKRRQERRRNSPGNMNNAFVFVQKLGLLLCVEAAAYLFRVHGGGTNGVDNNHVGPSVGVHQVAAVPLPQRVHHARLV